MHAALIPSAMPPSRPNSISPPPLVRPFLDSQHPFGAATAMGDSESVPCMPSAALGPPRSDSLFDLHAPTTPPLAGLLDLPLDLLTHIMHRLPLTDVLTCAHACHALYSPAVARLYSHPHLNSLRALHRFLASLTTANQNAAKRSEAPNLVRRLTLTIPLAELASDELARLGAQCTNLESLSVTDANALPAWSVDPTAPSRSAPVSGPMITFKLESLLSLTSQLTHLSLSHLNPLDMPHLITHLATHCPRLSWLAFNGCLTPPNDVLTWRSSVLALRRLSLVSLAIRGCKDHAPGALAVLMRDLCCPSLRSLTLAHFFVNSEPLAAGTLVGMLLRHPQLVNLEFEQVGLADPGQELDWLEEGIVQAWRVSPGRRGPRRRVVLKNIKGVDLDTVARVGGVCDGVVLELRQ